MPGPDDEVRTPAGGTTIWYKDSNTGNPVQVTDIAQLPVTATVNVTTGATTIADGADVTLGAKADAASTSSSASGTLNSGIKGLLRILLDVWDSVSHMLGVNLVTALSRAGVNAGEGDTIGAALATDALISGTNPSVVTYTPLFAKIAATASGQTAIVAADATHKIRVLTYTYVSDADVSVKWQSASTDLTGPMATGAKGGGVHAAFCPLGHFETVANQALNLNLSGTTNVNGHIVYILV